MRITRKEWPDSSSSSTTTAACLAHVREAEVDRSERRAARFDLGEALLQIGVVLASITLLTKRWFYVLVALALGAGGLAAAASALLIH